MRIGILGTGFAGKMHAGIYKTFPDVTLKGIVGRNKAVVTEAAESFGTEAFTDPHDLINSDDIDAIDVCYPTAIHAEYVIAALNAGKHVFCETPLTG